MKSKILFIFVFLLVISFNLSYSKNEGEIYIESNQEIIKNGEEIEITVNLKDAKTSAFNFSLYFDDSKLEVLSKQDNINIIENRIVYVWYDKSGGNDAKYGEIAKLKFRAKENGTVTFTLQGEFYSNEGQLINTDIEDKKIQIGEEESLLQQQSEESGTDSKKNNADLQVLRLNQEGITPQFNKNIYEYYITISNDIKDLEVLTVTENPNATIDVIGNKDLKEGLNTINVQVTSEDKTQTRLYSIQVTKTENFELANTNLEMLAIENVLLNSPFDNIETNYKAEVSNEMESVNILVVPENEHASVEVIGKENLKEGNNTITILVTAENNFTKRKYQVEVYRRNREEEKKYLEQQKENQKKLEYAYQIEELSKDVKEGISDNNLQYKNENKIIWVIVIIIGLIIVFVFTFWYLRHRK